MAYTTIDKPTDYFNTKLYAGNNSTQSITGVGFQPDWVWLKSRSDAGEHTLYDSVRGATKRLDSADNGAEDTVTNGLTSFDSDGFSLGAGGNENSASSIVAWNWLAGGSASSNTDGSITSTVSVNTTAGFSIVSYTGTNNNQTVGHGLGAAPKVIILKNRSTTNNWCVGHGSLGFTKHLALNENDAVGTSSVRFQDTAPTSTVYSVGAAGETNGSGNSIIAYCFVEKKGYSKFGSYTGNGNADGTFVYTGFKPAMVIFKNTGTANRQWQLLDNKRSSSGGNNVINITISPNNSNNESWWGTNNYADFLSNGFKLRASYDGVNESSGNYIYMAFAENPFVSSTGIPCTAR